ncbi:hypothetical protein L7F22_067520 [Adiantum nelumboides]|nr:hypothetical protein [Adiantum nelumboides]
MKNVFKLQDSDESMRGVTHTQAFELIECNKMDELLEEVLKSYEAYKAKHDFIVVEGASRNDAIVLNTKIAATLGLSILMVTDARNAADVGEQRIVWWDKLEWERGIDLSTQSRAFLMSYNSSTALGDILAHIKSLKAADKSVVVSIDVAHLNILLRLIALHQSNLYLNLSAIIVAASTMLQP